MENTTSKKRQVLHAVLLTAPCVVAYLVVYLARNILSALTPGMLETGNYTMEYISTISTANMLCYAVGQLVNGIIGNKIKGSFMVGMGLLCGGLCSIGFAFSDSLWLSAMLYGACGFFWSMLYAPMVRLISESVSPLYAPRCTIFLTIASFLGSPLAGVMALLFQWNVAFMISGGLQIAIGTGTLLMLLVLEKKGILVSTRRVAERAGEGGFRVLLKRRILRFSLVAIITGIVKNTVVFWIPTYFNQYLGFSEELAVTVYSVVTLMMAVAPALNLSIYEKLMRRNIHRSITAMFAVGALAFCMMALIKNPIANVPFLVLALIANGGAATMLWNVYCPSLRDTGVVSGATGYLDFVSYMASAGANIFFPKMVGWIGWGGLIAVWCGFLVVGGAAYLPLIWKKKAVDQAEN